MISYALDQESSTESTPVIELKHILVKIKSNQKHYIAMFVQINISVVNSIWDFNVIYKYDCNVMKYVNILI